MKDIINYILESAKTFISICDKETGKIYAQEPEKTANAIKLIDTALELRKNSNNSNHYVITRTQGNKGDITLAENVIFDTELMEKHNDKYCKIINSDGMVEAIGNYTACEEYMEGYDNDINFMPKLVIVYISKKEFDFYKTQNIQILK